MNITPALGDRGLAVGRTGSGKTTTMKQVLRAMGQLHQIVMVDTKGEELLEEITPNVITDPKSALKETGRHVLYRPEGNNLYAEAVDWFLLQLYNARRSLVLYVDEVNQVAPNPRPGLGLMNCIQRGRHRKTGREQRPAKLTVLMSTQRPSSIPLICYTESDHFYIHKLMRKDNKRVSEMVESDIILDKPVKGHEFYYWNVRNMEDPQRLILPPPRPHARLRA